MIFDLVTHLVVSTLILAAVTAAASWIPRLTARTRHAILLAGLAALLLPSALFARFFELLSAKPLPALPAMIPDFGAMPLALAVRERAPIPWTYIAFFTWVAVAAILFIRWWMTSRRFVASATRIATAPPARVVAALEAARRRISLHRSVDIVTSPLCEAPAVVRVVRPLIVLPADGCAVLEDDELESLLCHECAHVARRDNLIGVIEAVICSAFWFNPMVWLAHRRIASAREAACDELVADSATDAGTYVGALNKFCRTLLAPRIAGVSCMASAHLKERIQHLMSYPSLQKSALSHRASAATAFVAVLAFIVAAGAVTAKPRVEPKGDRYRLNYSMSKAEGAIRFTARIMDTAANQVLAEPILLVRGGQPTSAEISRDDNRWQVMITPDGPDSGRITLTAWVDGVQVQQTDYPFHIPASEAAPVRYQGEPITLDLKDADLRDVLHTFGALTGLTIIPAPEVQGRINIHFVDTPWDEALDRILTENGYASRLEGNQMHVFRPGSGSK